MRRASLGLLVVTLTACAPEVQLFRGGEGGAADEGSGGATSSGTSHGGEAEQGGTEEGTASSSGTSTSSGFSSAQSSASVGSSGSAGMTVTATSTGSSSVVTVGGSTGSGGFCKSCSDALFGDLAPFCAGSELLFDDLVVCACDQGCPMACQEACAGGPMPPACETCIQQTCGAPLDACLDDN